MASSPTALNSTDREVWERLPQESIQAFAAWQAYLAMNPPRSLRRLSQELHRHINLLNGWSRRWRWQRRLEAFLAHEAQRKAREHQQAVESTKARHISIAKLLQNRALERLQSLEISKLSPDLIVKFLDLAVSIERESLDLDAKKPGQQNNTNVSVTEFSLSETRDLQSDLQEKLQQLSPVSRDIMRQLTVKTLRLLKFQSENLGIGDQFKDQSEDHGPTADTVEQPAGSETDDKPGADGGSEPPAP